MAAGELIMRCFHARTAAHVLHLKTKSYAAHKALQEFYDGVVPLVDSFAEAYQGEYGLIEDYPAKFVMPSDGMALLEDLCTWIGANRYKCCDEDATFLHNIIDEIVELAYATKYKLKFLK